MEEVKWPHCLPLYLTSRHASTVLRKGTVQFTTGTVFSLFVHHLPLQLQTELCNSIELQLKYTILYRAVERDPVENFSEDPQAFLQSENEHLSHVHLQYFSHWLLLCTLEARTKGGRRNIWLQTAQERWVFYKI